MQPKMYSCKRCRSIWKISGDLNHFSYSHYKTFNYFRNMIGPCISAIQSYSSNNHCVETGGNLDFNRRTSIKGQEKVNELDGIICERRSNGPIAPPHPMQIQEAKKGNESSCKRCSTLWHIASLCCNTR